MLTSSNFESVKSRIVVRFALVAETFGLADACEAAVIMKHDLRQDTLLGIC